MVNGKSPAGRRVFGEMCMNQINSVQGGSGHQADHFVGTHMSSNLRLKWYICHLNKNKINCDTDEF
jgi:hypothetical protein